MAMAITSVTECHDTGEHFDVVLLLTGSGTYTTGGETVSWKNMKIKTKSDPYFGQGVASDGCTAIYLPATDKVQLWSPAEAGEFTSGASLTGITVQMHCLFNKV